MLVMKFGGSSLADAACFEKVAAIVLSHAPKGLSVVVSAMSKVTDALLRLGTLAVNREEEALESAREELSVRHKAVAQALLRDPHLLQETRDFQERLFEELREVCLGVSLLRELSPRTLDFIGSFGERLSAQFLSAVLRDRGRDAVFADARDFFRTDRTYQAAEVNLETSRTLTVRHLAPIIDRGGVPIVTGFIGSTADGITTTLGRNGSDYSASILGALLEASEIWIWTDVDGVMTADPRLVKEARVVPVISYREAAEMSYFGAKVIHPKTMIPAVAKGIPIWIKNTFNPEFPGTVIQKEPEPTDVGIKTVTSIRGLCLVTLEGSGMIGVPGVARRLFDVTASENVNVMMISQASSEHTISIIIPQEDAGTACRSIGAEFAKEIDHGAIDQVTRHCPVGIIAIIGEGMRGTPGISGAFFQALGQADINVCAISQGSSELNISAAVDEIELVRAVRAVHTAFGLTKVLNLFLFGYGNIGRTLVRQILENRETFFKRGSIQLRLLGVSNSRHMVFAEDGLSGVALDHLQSGKPLDACPGAGPSSTPSEVLDILGQGRDTEVVIIDVTAANTTDLHLKALESGFHVVTANKKPVSDRMDRYRQLRALSHQKGCHYNFETTFGAGLPLLFTLQDLLSTGDQFLEVVGCFSGTLGYICSSLDGGGRLSKVTQDAFQRGYTEPDPRDDLRGLDVARKALIIARELGYELDLDAFTVEGLVPNEYLDTPDLETFWKRLPELDGEYARRVEEARGRGAVLRYVAEIREQKWAVGLREFPVDSPFGRLKGPDNLVMYRTARYRDNPLVIQGPGAGAEVTAAGVLGDILKIGRSVR